MKKYLKFLKAIFFGILITAVTFIYENCYFSMDYCGRGFPIPYYRWLDWNVNKINIRVFLLDIVFWSVIWALVKFATYFYKKNYQK